MPDINSLKESKYLRKEDCGPGILLTITGGELRNVAMQGQPPKNKWVVFFQETEKPWVSNSRGRQRVSIITGSTNTDNWPGYKVVLFNDPDVEYAGKLIGGISVRAPKNQNPAPVAGGAPAPAPKPAPAATVPPADDADDDLPF